MVKVVKNKVLVSNGPAAAILCASRRCAIESVGEYKCAHFAAAVSIPVKRQLHQRTTRFFPTT